MDPQQKPEIQLSVSAIAALNDGNKIEAIKLLRQEQGIGLKEAKDVVEDYLRNNPELQSHINQHQAESARGCMFWVIIIILTVTAVIYFL